MSASDHLSPHQFPEAIVEQPDEVKGHPYSAYGPGQRRAVFDPKAGPSDHPYFKDHPGLVGFIDTFHQKDDGYSGKPAVHISYMSVRPDYQGRGIASHLAEQTVSSAGKQGASVEWGKLAHDASVHLFEKSRKQHPDVPQYGKYF